MSDNGSGIQASVLPWTLAGCTCGARDCSHCSGARVDAHAAIRREVTEHFVSYRGGVYRFLLSRGVAPHDAEDIAQEVFFRLFRERLGGRVIEARYVLPWTLMVARNLAVDHFRRQRGEPVLFELSDAATVARSDGRDGESALVDRERRSAVERGMRVLTPLQRTCMNLRAEGLSLRDTSARVGISERQVSDAVQRGIRRLRKIINALA